MMGGTVSVNLRMLMSTMTIPEVERERVSLEGKSSGKFAASGWKLAIWINVTL